MNNLKSHFRFNRQERSGIFFLLLIIVSLQVGYYFFHHFCRDTKQDSLTVDDDMQSQIDVLKQAALQKDSIKTYPFNPNFITDYKGYAMGMSVEEIDRLHAFRKQNKFANTTEEFQKVTQVSDSLLAVISPYFKFPEWTKTRNRTLVNSYQSNGVIRSSKYSTPKTNASNQGRNDIVQDIDTKDLNSATAEELQTIYGIGEKLSARIIKFRDKLGGFLIDDQLYDVYGLETEVVKRTLQKFRVLKKPDIQKINVNTASVSEMATLVYLQKWVAESIVDYRNINNGILSLDELKNIEGFPSDKIDRLALYLSL